MDIDNPRTRQHMQAGRQLRVVDLHLGGEGVGIRTCRPHVCVGNTTLLANKAALREPRPHPHVCGGTSRVLVSKAALHEPGQALPRVSLTSCCALSAGLL